MPFTVSHVAAVLPVHRWLSRAGLFTAAVIGSMSPDFGVILFHDFGRWRTHSAMGLVRFCLPVGLAALAITRYVVKPAFVEILPDGAYLRASAKGPTAGRMGLLGWCYAALAILAGAITHLVWDGFTHEGAPGVRMFPVLDEVGPDIDGHTLRVWRLLQYGSSIAGLVAVVAALWLWLGRAARDAHGAVLQRTLGHRERMMWSALYCAVPLACLLLGFIRHGAGAYWPLTGPRLGALLYLLMRGAAVSLVGVSVLLRFRTSASA